MLRHFDILAIYQDRDSHQCVLRVLFRCVQAFANYCFKMVKMGLRIKANLTNVDKLYPKIPEEFSWALKVKCSGCNEENPNWHLISEEDKVELVNAKANFMYKCKCCSRENYLTIVPLPQILAKSKGHKKNIDMVYTDADDDTFKTIVAFDCRGLELVDFEPREGWAVESGRKIFEDVDLTNKDWVEYNDIDNVPVEINNFTHEFEYLK